MSGGSQQLRIFRRAIRDGVDIEAAAASAGMAIIEARAWLKDDTQHPPPTEAFELLYDPEAAGCAVNPQEHLTMPTHDLTDDTPERDDPLIELAADTLRGDLRDSLLAWFKAQPKSWPFMAEREQRDLADAADRYAYEAVKQVAQIIAAGERPCIVAKLVEYKEKDGVEAKLKLASKGEIVAALHEACGRDVLIVTSGAEEFLGEAGPAEIDPEQPDLGIGDEYREAA